MASLYLKTSGVGAILQSGAALAVSSNCCCAPGCGCTTNLHGSFDITLAGITNGVCTNSSAVNGLFNAPWNSSSSSVCDWVWRGSGTGCANNPQIVFLEVYLEPLSGQYALEVSMQNTSAFWSNDARWRKLMGTNPFDCSAQSSVVLNFLRVDNNGGLNYTYTGSTATITFVP